VKPEKYLGKEKRKFERQNNELKLIVRTESCRFVQRHK
jgi:hypothetical protein